MSCAKFNVQDVSIAVTILLLIKVASIVSWWGGGHSEVFTCMKIPTFLGKACLVTDE